jgi:hypothetical protein
MSRLLVLVALWCPMVAACCHGPRVVSVTPPPCRERDHPDPPVGAVAGSQAWADWFAFGLVPWVLEVERACPKAKADAPAPNEGAW